jgi:hypothetical protein
MKKKTDGKKNQNVKISLWENKCKLDIENQFGTFWGGFFLEGMGNEYTMGKKY